MLKFSGLGRLTKDPVVRQVGESSVTKFGMAFSRKIKDKEYTDFFDFEAWGKVGELIAQFCGKGDQLFVSGEPRQEKWEKDGQQRTSVSFRVEDMTFVSNKSKESRPEPKNTVAPVSSPVEVAEIPF